MGFNTIPFPITSPSAKVHFSVLATQKAILGYIRLLRFFLVQKKLAANPHFPFKLHACSCRDGLLLLTKLLKKMG